MDTNWPWSTSAEGGEYRIYYILRYVWKYNKELFDNVQAKLCQNVTLYFLPFRNLYWVLPKCFIFPKIIEIMSFYLIFLHSTFLFGISFITCKNELGNINSNDVPCRQKQMTDVRNSSRNIWDSHSEVEKIFSRIKSYIPEVWKDRKCLGLNERYVSCGKEHGFKVTDLSILEFEEVWLRVLIKIYISRGSMDMTDVLNLLP